jgi:hypothetical protein
MSTPKIRTQLVFGCILASAATSAHAEWSFTPRAALWFDNAVQRQTGIDFNNDPARLKYIADQQATIAAINSITPALAFFGVVVPPTTVSADASTTARRTTQAKYPQFGGTLTFDWRGSETTQLALTALYGETDAELNEITTQYFRYSAFNSSAIDSIELATSAEGRLKRLDLEITMQHRLNENFSLIGGVRAERTEARFDFSTTSFASANLYNLFAYNLTLIYLQNNLPVPPNLLPTYTLNPAATTGTQTQTTWIYSGRFGAAAYAPVGEKHLFYVNGLVHVSHTPQANSTQVFSNGFTSRTRGFADETTIGPDISVGYMYRFTDRFGVDLRYRAAVYFPVSGDFDFEDARVNHGASIGFTTWFDE